MFQIIQTYHVRFQPHLLIPPVNVEPQKSNFNLKNQPLNPDNFFPRKTFLSKKKLLLFYFQNTGNNLSPREVNWQDFFIFNLIYFFQTGAQQQGAMGGMITPTQGWFPSN